MKVLFLVTALAIQSTAHAEKKQLDLNLDPAPFYQEKPEPSPWYRDDNYKSADQQLSSECLAMQQQIRELKGKPQQKFALQQRYEVECQR